MAMLGVHPRPVLTKKIPIRLQNSRRQKHCLRFRVLSSSQLATPESGSSSIKIPKSIKDVDSNRLLGFGAELAENHPGFFDIPYKQRRKMITEIARDHVMGTPIPRIEYTAEEKKTWKEVFLRLNELYPLYACKEFNECFPKFGFTDDEIPQLEDVSQFLKKQTGWQIQPVAGTLHPRSFLNGLAFKTFHSIQFLRHHSRPMFSVEPDLIHELFGHVALLANPAYCQLIHAIGTASLGASEAQLKHLTKVYYYTVEFGTLNEGSDIKAFGAAILSSFGEMKWMAEGNVKLEPFNPYIELPKMIHRAGFQQEYFYLDSFQDAAQLLTSYVSQTR